jgi:molybdopterin converting factor small subunit
MDAALELRNLAPEPQDEWRRMLRFVRWGDDEKVAASRSVETLFRRGPELVVQTYDYLRRVPETAAILGWDQGVDEAHLEERRRFFTVWLARTLGLDTSDEFAHYLFRAGKYHAGHGPRHIHTPSEYVTGSVGLVLAAFAGYMSKAGLPAGVVAAAMAAWGKYLAAQLNQMLLGYRIAQELEEGNFSVRCSVYGRLRPLLGTQETQVGARDGARIADVLGKFFDYYPQARHEALDRIWNSEERSDALWVEVTPTYVPRPGWRVLLNGRDLNYAGGFAVPVHEKDVVAIFPPGR